MNQKQQQKKEQKQEQKNGLLVRLENGAIQCFMIQMCALSLAGSALTREGVKDMGKDVAVDTFQTLTDLDDTEDEQVDDMTGRLMGAVMKRTGRRY